MSRTTGIRVAPQPAPRNANPVPLPRTKFDIDSSPEVEEKNNDSTDTSPTPRILAQTIPPKSGHEISSGQEIKSDQDSKIDESESPPQYQATSPTTALKIIPKSQQTTSTSASPQIHQQTPSISASQQMQSLTSPEPQKLTKSKTPQISQKPISSSTTSQPPTFPPRPQISQKPTLASQPKQIPDSPNTPSSLSTPTKTPPSLSISSLLSSPSSPDPTSPPPKPPRTYKHKSARQIGDNERMVSDGRDPDNTGMIRDGTGDQRSPATPRPGLIMRVLSPALLRSSKLKSPAQENQQKGTNPIPSPPPQYMKPSQSSTATSNQPASLPSNTPRNQSAFTPNTQPQSLQPVVSTNTQYPNTQPVSLPINTKLQSAPKPPPQSAKPRSTSQTNQPNPLHPTLPSHPSSSELNVSKDSHNEGDNKREEKSGRQNDDGENAGLRRDRQNRQRSGENMRQNNTGHNIRSGQRQNYEERNESRIELMEQTGERQNRNDGRNRRNNEQRNVNSEQRTGTEYRKPNEQRHHRENREYINEQQNIIPPSLQPTRPAPPPVPKKNLRPQPACTAEEFEASCTEVFRHRHAAGKHAAAGRYAQAAKHYQTSLTAMDKVLGSHVLAITPSEPTRQHLFLLQEKVFTVRKEILHGFMDAQTLSSQTPSRLAISATHRPIPGAPPSYEDVLKEDQRRQQEEIPPLPPRQPSMRGRASQYTRPQQSHSARYIRTNSGSEQGGSSRAGTEGESRRPLGSSVRPRPPSLRTRPSSVGGVSAQDTRVETLVDVSGSGRNPSTPATAPPTFASQPLSPTQVSIRPKSYHSESNTTILTPLNPTPAVSSQPSQASKTVSQSPKTIPLSSDFTPSFPPISNPSSDSPASLPPQHSSSTSSRTPPSVSPISVPPFIAPAKDLGAKPKGSTSSSSDPSSPMSPDVIDEVMESQMAALELCQTKRGTKETLGSNSDHNGSSNQHYPTESQQHPSSLQHISTHQHQTSKHHPHTSAHPHISTKHPPSSSSPPLSPETPPPLPVSSPPVNTNTNAHGLFSDFKPFSPFSSLTQNTINFKPMGETNKAKVPETSKLSKIEDPFKNVDPFPPVSPQDISTTSFPDETPLPSNISGMKEDNGENDTDNLGTETHFPDSKSFSVKNERYESENVCISKDEHNMSRNVRSSKDGQNHRKKIQVSIPKDEHNQGENIYDNVSIVKHNRNESKNLSPKEGRNQNESFTANFANFSDHEDSILEALDPAITPSHPRATPRRSNTGSVLRCHSEETLLDHSYGTLEAVLRKADKGKSASRASIIEEFDPLVTTFLNDTHTDGTEADQSQNSNGTAGHIAGGYTETSQDTEGLAKGSYHPLEIQDEVIDTRGNYSQRHDTERFKETYSYHQAMQSPYDEEVAAGVSLSTKPVKLRGAYPKVPRVPRCAGIIRDHDGEQEERPVVYQEEGATAEEERWGRGDHDLYYDNDEDFDEKGIGTDMRDSFSSSNSQKSWPQDQKSSRLYQTTDLPHKSDVDGESMDIGRLAFYRANSQPESPSNSYRHLLRIREGVKIFFIHNDGVITSPYNKPILFVTKDVNRNSLVGEGVMISVGLDDWKCELYRKQTMVLKTLSDVYLFNYTNGKPECHGVGIRVPNNVRKAQHELLLHILQENTMLEEERPTGITKAISKSASSAVTRVNTIVGTQLYDNNQPFIRRNSIRALKGMSRRLNVLAEKTGSTMGELPSEYTGLQEMADQLRVARSTKMIQYI